MKIQNLQVLVMDNNEILCQGKTVGFTQTLGKYLSGSITEQEKNGLLEALNHMDTLADIGADEGEKSDLQKSYNYLFNFISNLK